MTTHPEDYAFPVAPGDVPYWQPGMSLRDWFAGQALVGMVANPNNVHRTSVIHSNWFMSSTPRQSDESNGLL